MGEQQEYYIGLDIGGTKCAVTLGKFEGDDLTIVDKIKFATNPEELQRGKRAPSEVLDEFVLQTQRLLAKHNGAPKRVGISCGGPLETRDCFVASQFAGLGSCGSCCLFFQCLWRGVRTAE